MSIGLPATAQSLNQRLGQLAVRMHQVMRRPVTDARSQFAGLAALTAIARQQACRRCGQPASGHWHYRASPSGDRACSRYRPPRRRFFLSRFLWRIS